MALVTSWLMQPGEAPDVSQLLRRPAWHAGAACRGVGAPTFVLERGQSSTPAKALCARCSVRSECLAEAISDADRLGIWGGTTERERRAMRRARIGDEIAAAGFAG